MNYNHYRTNKPELLSPVGNWESLYAAIQNGCDAIYLGGKSFNARQRADNFTTQELKEVFHYAHVRNVKVYVTVNILYKNQEIKNVLKFIEKIYSYGVDGVIVQDLGIAKLINENFPDLELHASTQMTVHNVAGAKYLEKIGFSRVVLARELTLKEIKEIITKTNLKVETFIHGALCICYSGQCLMSSLIGGRSGNRGRCAQPCRLPYSLVDLEDKESIKEEFDEKYLLSPKDINTLKILPKLIDAGISSFKIEGRMKRPEYTALVTKKYRKYIDQYLLNNRNNYEIKEQDQKEITQIFNRGSFIPGYYQGKEELNLISYQRPKNWGLKIGEVINYNKQTQECEIKLIKNIKVNQGDGIEIWTKRGKNPGLTLSKFNQGNPNLIEIKIGGQIKSGDPVYRTADKELLDEMQKSYQSPNTYKEIEIYGQFSAKINNKMKLKIWDQKGYYCSETSDFIPEEAKNQPISRNDIKEQLNKLGDTPYKFGNLELEVDQNLFIPISKLNQLRRKVIKQLNQKRSNQFITTPRNNKLKTQSLKLDSNTQPKENKLAVYVKEKDYLLDIIKLKEVDKLYCDSEILDNLFIDKLIEKSNNYETEIFIKLPQIAREKEVNQIKKQFEMLESKNINGYLVSQLGMAELVKDSNKKLIADYAVNNFNSYTIKHWDKEGYQEVILSPELNLSEIKKMMQYSDISKEVIVYGHLPMMITEYCPIGGVMTNFNPSQGCDHKCSNQNYGLLDRKGMIAPVITDPKNCKSIIYNSQPLYLGDYLSELNKISCQSYRLDFINEDREEIKKIIKLYYAKLDDNSTLNAPEIRNINNKLKREGYTTGHFYRGVK